MLEARLGQTGGSTPDYDRRMFNIQHVRSAFGYGCHTSHISFYLCTRKFFIDPAEG